MPRFPYINFPFPLYKIPYKNSNSFNNFSKLHSTSTLETAITPPLSSINTIANNVKSTNIVHKNATSENPNKKNKSNKNIDDYLFDLFGLKIYSDDVLLVSLIYFLYSEEVKDDGLFIVLILLLLS